MFSISIFRPNNLLNVTPTVERRRPKRTETIRRSEAAMGIPKPRFEPPKIGTSVSLESRRIHRPARDEERLGIGRFVDERRGGDFAWRIQGGELDRHQVGVGNVADFGIPGRLSTFRKTGI